MSGLGFSKQEEKTVEPEQDEDDLALHNIQIPVVSSEEVSQERISFSQPTQRYEARKISSAPEQPREKKEFPAKKQHGNISIGQGTYKPKEKVVATAADFARFQAEKAPEKKSELLKNIILHNLRKGLKRDLRISQLHQRYTRKLQLQQIL